MSIDPRFIKPVNKEELEVLRSMDSHLASLNASIREGLPALNGKLDRIETLMKKVLAESEGRK